MLVALGTIASQQAKATRSTMAVYNWLLEYATINPIAKIQYHTSGMQLYSHIGDSYLSEAKARS